MWVREGAEREDGLIRQDLNMNKPYKIKPVNLKGNQPWILIGRTDAEAEVPILWSPDVKSWLTGKDPEAENNWGQEEKGTAEDEMAGWHHQLNEHEFEEALGGSVRQGSLVYCSPWNHKDLEMAEQLNLYAEYIMRNAVWMKHKLESRLPGEISVTSDMKMTPFLWQKTRRTKEPLDESGGEEWKSWLTTQHSEN